MAHARSRKSARPGTRRPSARIPKYVYAFANGKAEGSSALRNLLGGKGCELAEMTNLGVPVPPGFTITTEAWAAYNGSDKKHPPGLWSQVTTALARLEAAAGARLGDAARPLLVSVRSGARASMPGMMDTVLNLGLNDETVAGLIEESGDERFAWDTFRRFIHMYGDVVLGVKHELFESKLDELKHARRVKQDTELSAKDLKKLCESYRAVVHETTGADFPSDPFEQLRGAISAVFLSWNTPRAETYRKLNNIPQEWGTAVNVQ